MTAIAREAGVTREALYKALSDKGDPKFSTLLGVVKALGMKFELKKIEAAGIGRSAAACSHLPPWWGRKQNHGLSRRLSRRFCKREGGLFARTKTPLTGKI